MPHRVTWTVLGAATVVAALLWLTLEGTNAVPSSPPAERSSPSASAPAAAAPAAAVVKDAADGRRLVAAPAGGAATAPFVVHVVQQTDDQPVSGAEVWYPKADRPWSALTVEERKEWSAAWPDLEAVLRRFGEHVVTDAEGHAQLPVPPYPLSDNSWWYACARSGPLYGEQWVDARRPRSPLTIRMAVDRAVTVRVVDGNGKPQATVAVCAVMRTHGCKCDGTSPTSCRGARRRWAPTTTGASACRSTIAGRAACSSGYAWYRSPLPNRRAPRPGRPPLLDP